MKYEKTNESLDTCYMKLEDVLKMFPQFKQVETFESLSGKGSPTGVIFVKCEEVKAFSAGAWEKLTAENIQHKNWFHYHRDQDVRLVLKNSPELDLLQMHKRVHNGDDK